MSLELRVCSGHHKYELKADAKAYQGGTRNTQKNLTVVFCLPCLGYHVIDFATYHKLAGTDGERGAGARTKTRTGTGRSGINQ